MFNKYRIWIVFQFRFLSLPPDPLLHSAPIPFIRAIRRYLVFFFLKRYFLLIFMKKKIIINFIWYSVTRFLVIEPSRTIVFGRRQWNSWTENLYNEWSLFSLEALLIPVQYPMMELKRCGWIEHCSRVPSVPIVRSYIF